MTSCNNSDHKYTVQNNLKIDTISIKIDDKIILDFLKTDLK